MLLWRVSLGPGLLCGTPVFRYATCCHCVVAETVGLTISCSCGLCCFWAYCMLSYQYCCFLRCWRPAQLLEIVQESWHYCVSPQAGPHTGPVSPTYADTGCWWKILPVFEAPQGSR